VAQLEGVKHGDVVDVSGKMLAGSGGDYVRTSVAVYTIVGALEVCD